jgi:hypothetical protein
MVMHARLAYPDRSDDDGRDDDYRSPLDRRYLDPGYYGHDFDLEILADPDDDEPADCRRAA